MKSKQLGLLPHILFGISLCFIPVYLFLLIEIPGCFKKAFDLGQLMYNFSLNIVAAYVFYLFIDFLPKNKRKRHLLVLLQTHVLTLETTVNHILENLPNFSSDSNVVMLITEVELEALLLSTVPSHQVNIQNLSGQKMTITDLIASKQDIIKFEIEQLEKHNEIFSEEFYSAIVEVKRCSLPIIVRGAIITAANNKLNIPNLVLFKSEFWKLIIAVRNVKNIWEENEM